MTRPRNFRKSSFFLLGLEAVFCSLLQRKGKFRTETSEFKRSITIKLYFPSSERKESPCLTTFLSLNKYYTHTKASRGTINDFPPRKKKPTRPIVNNRQSRAALYAVYTRRDSVDTRGGHSSSAWSHSYIDNILSDTHMQYIYITLDRHVLQYISTYVL